MRKIEGTLPASGRHFVLKEMTGLVELSALRQLADHPEIERQAILPVEQVALCLELDGKPLTGHADILALPSRDLQFLLAAHTRLNAPAPQDLEVLEGFFGNSSSSSGS